MRIPAFLAVFLFLAGPVSAATLLEDDAGDHEYTIANAAGDPSQMPALDLISIALEETEDAFTFALEVAELDAQDVEIQTFNGGGGIQYYIHFSYEGVDYRVAIYRFADRLGGDVDFFARFQVYDEGRDRFDNVDALNVEADLNSDILTVPVDRDEVLSADGAEPRRGTSLTGFFAVSQTSASVDWFGTGAPPVYEGGDAMPDDGVSSIEWPIQFGLEQSGNARLWSDMPVRTSNGEATTFLFSLLAENVGENKDTFMMTAPDIPDDWEVTFPEGRIKLDAGGSVEVPVLVTVPFNHKHGFYQPMLVEMTSMTQPDSVGRVELGIRYTDVPQPAGHHDRLFLHRGESNEWLDESPLGAVVSDADKYFNTLEDDEFATPGDLPRSYPVCEGTEIFHTFEFMLAPSLDMGLDFDLERTGLLELAFTSETPMTGVRFQGDLRYGFLEESETPQGPQQGRGGPRIEYLDIAQVDPVALADVAAGGTANVEADISALPNADYLPYRPGAFLNLRLEIVETLPAPDVGFSCFAIQKQPAIKPGGTFTLPLNEYHDVIDASFAGSSGLELLSDDALKRFVNPGKAALFNIQAENLGDEPVDFLLGLTGTNVEWAAIAGEPRLRLEAGETRKIQIAISIPETAADGLTADVSLVATSAADENLKSVIRMVAEVDTDAEYPDDSAAIAPLFEAPPAKESPGAPVALLLAGFALVAMRRRV